MAITAVSFSLSEEEAAAAQWAIGEWVATFAQVVAKGHMRRSPPAPALDGMTLRLPLNIDALEELDYQLTIGMRDHEERMPVGLDPAVGKRLATRIRTELPAGMRLSV